MFRVFFPLYPVPSLSYTSVLLTQVNAKELFIMTHPVTVKKSAFKNNFDSNNILLLRYLSS